MKRKLLFYVLGVMAVVGAGGAGGAVSLLAARQLGYLKRSGTGGPADSSGGAAKDHAASKADEVAKVTASGRIRPKDGVINVSGMPGDRLLTLRDAAQEGRQVEKGTPLAELESSHLRQAELELAESQFKEAIAREKAEAGYAAALLDEANLAKEQLKLETHERDALEKKIEVFQAQEKSANDDLRRLQALRASDDDKIVSDQMLEHQKLLVAKTGGELAASKDQLTKLNESIELGARQADAKILTAEASKARIPSTVQLDSLEKNVELARKRLDTTKISAPSSGTILKVYLSPGETLAQQPILQMADTSKMVVVAEIPEEQAHEVREGCRAEITAKALGKVLEGTVTHMGTIVARNPVAPSSPTAPADKHVVEALIDLAGVNDAMEAARLIELEVLVTVFVSNPTASGADAAPSSAGPNGSR
ncbi:MAG TPA: efflux RND transporter periplasmic adaptor subunit [Pirellulales bacterium]|nr:efflux RND transporter periplasmic adaptor subunit [Pirellulales bacterium]